MHSHDNQPEWDATADSRAIRQGRFVVLWHVLPADSPRPSHWDFMLETAAGLRTWALASPPDEQGPIAAESLADHRPEYLTYEGPISGGRGHVERWDAGTFMGEPGEADDLPHESTQPIAVRLSGSRLRGLAVLIPDAVESQRWRFSFTADPT